MASSGGHASHSRIPEWNGEPNGWQRWKDEVRFWRMSESLNVEWSMAARLVSGLRGPARRVALTMSEKDLYDRGALLEEDDGPQASDEEHSERSAVSGSSAARAEATRRERARGLRRRGVGRGGGKGYPPFEPRYEHTKVEANARGIDNLIALLASRLQPQKIVQKGQTMHEFFATRKWFRRSGQRFTDFNTFFDEAITKLTEVEVVLTDDILGFFYLRAAGLTPERRERVMSCLPSEALPYEEIRRICVRLFPDVHTTESRRDRREANITEFARDKQRT